MAHRMNLLIAGMAILASLFSVAETKATSPKGLALADVGDAYSFVICADPQLGHADDQGRVASNARKTLIQSIEEINAMTLQPAFVVFLGDLCNVFDEASVDNFETCAAALKTECVLVHGNHDTRPPYEAFRALQERLNGIEDVFYSFDASPWHYVVIPCNLPGQHTPEIEAEKAMLEWLAADLEANRHRPTAIFSHLHLMPQGLSQTEWYTFPLALREKLMALFTKYGNVKYYFNGHVHNGIKNATKLAWEDQGIRFFTVPTIIQSRPFGDGEFAGFEQGLERGGYYLVVDVEGDTMTLKGRLAGVDKEHTFPEACFRPFDDTIEPRWRQRTVAFPASDALVNGGFDKGLDGWFATYRYKSDEDPGYVWETRSDASAPGNAALRIQTREKGQDWANDEYTEVYRVVAAPEDGTPVLNARYRVDPYQSGGGYIRLHAMNNEEFLFLMMFRWGEDEQESDYLPRSIGYSIFGEQQSWAFLQQLGEKKQGMFWNVADTPGEWHALDIDIASLYDRAQGAPGAFEALGVNKYLIALGTWSNKHPGSHSAASFDDIVFTGVANPPASANNARALQCGASIFENGFGQCLIDRLDVQVRERETKR